MGPASSSGTHASRQHLSQSRGCGRLQCPLPPGFAQQCARQVGHQLLSLSAAQRTGPEGRGLAQQSVHLPTGGPRRPDCGLSLGRVGFGPRKDAVPMSRRCGSRSMCSRKQRGGGARAGWAPGLWNKSLHSSSKRDGHLTPGPQTVYQVSAGPLDDEGVLGPRQGAAGSTEHLLRACGLSSRWSVKPCPAPLRWLPAWGTQGCATGQLLQPQRSTGVILDHLAPPLAGEKRSQSPPDLRRAPVGSSCSAGPWLLPQRQQQLRKVDHTGRASAASHREKNSREQQKQWGLLSPSLQEGEDWVRAQGPPNAGGRQVSSAWLCLLDNGHQEDQDKT